MCQCEYSVKNSSVKSYSVKNYIVKNSSVENCITLNISAQNFVYMFIYSCDIMCLNRCADYILAMTCDFQQSGILTSVDSDESVQPPF